MSLFKEGVAVFVVVASVVSGVYVVAAVVVSVVAVVVAVVVVVVVVFVAGCCIVVGDVVVIGVGTASGRNSLVLTFRT